MDDMQPEEQPTKPIDHQSTSKPSWSCMHVKDGGFRAASFVFAFLALDSMAFVANMLSLVMYFYLVMHFSISESANTLTNLMGSTFLLSIVGAFISDAYLNRYYTCLCFGLLEVLALAMMTIQANTPSLLPKPCLDTTCVRGGPSVMLYASLCMLALGSGGVRGALPALGADQFDQKNPKEAKALARYFNFLLLATTLGAAIGVTVIVWVSFNRGWWRGFLICTTVTFGAFCFLAVGKPFYRLQKPGESPILRISRVVVVALKNRKMVTPDNACQLYELDESNDSVTLEDRIPHSRQFKWLDKAAIIVKSNSDDPKVVKTCTITQVEEVKILIRMLPIICSTIIMNTCLAQLQTFSVQQGYRMNRFLGTFLVPESSIPVIPLLFMSVLIPIYDFLFVPFARKYTKHPSGITQLQRIGVGLVLSIISMAAAALVEVKRRNQSLKNPLQPISLFWLSFQYGIFGVADLFTLVGLLEFFYKEAPIHMRSLSTSFTWISLSIGYFLSTILVNIVNAATEKGAKNRGWLEDRINLDNNKLDRFYWLLAILSAVNFFNYLFWASWYKYKVQDSVENGDACYSVDLRKNSEEQKEAEVKEEAKAEEKEEAKEEEKTKGENEEKIEGNEEKSNIQNGI
ncbi:protein NRT1/ PTR FAMILY 4.5-like [Impatiens glandulifera]|uniref:protein NRT1/ PTR FAMILY 4.5-like n=1 Tax=Impatiens glandulifera TaxID=253017 RepID=UPI001FB11438|nr:protein NRT1/ PTR FAMILY 4.5-like [Impatiens glandulifera]